MIVLAWIAAALTLQALVTTIINALTWARQPRVLPATCPPVSVLVPARNEAANIGPCLAAMAANGADITDITVCDDRSTDATPQLLADAQTAMPHLRVIPGTPLPDGWVGKAWACAQLADQATGSWLLFLDADVTLTPDGVRRLLALQAESGADLVTAVPRQRMGSWLEDAVLPMLHLTYTSWLPLALIPRVADPRVLAANGQVLLVRRTALAQLGGFAAIRAEVVDDMALCRRAKAAGLRVLFADGDAIATCRMYQNAGEVWRGFSKNLFEGVGGGWGLLGVTVLYALAFLLPWAWLALPGPVPLPIQCALGFQILQRVWLAFRHHHGLRALLLHPVGVAALLLIGANSWRWSQRGQVAWRGRTYAARADRTRALPLTEVHDA